MSRRRNGIIKMMRFGMHTLPVRVPTRKVTTEEFERRTRPIFLKMAKKMEKLEKQGKRISRRV